MSKNIELLLSLTSMHTSVFKNIDRHLSVHGISFSEFFVMYQLSLVSNRTVRRIDLAESVGMSASGITRLLNPMEKLKLVEKEQNPRDARVSFVKLSDVGFELLNDAIKSVQIASDGLFKSLDINDIERFIDLTNKIK
ncbi:MAG: MarR family transcriptional regulator [Sulfuricurvum sp.]|uniref:MarR family winged helix-turn-helix transcriptional regulator n=1 Tax=uncultured Sulfuricurvum sp. TaxID=430693 RepID=UPI0026066F30|nr:MarR family transcriptional regulator [uncultured Sulfuricurvum sp.]MDD2837974.1 MarR family transcriptional regulator [Sulfuricurvum sp.]